MFDVAPNAKLPVDCVVQAYKTQGKRGAGVAQCMWYFQCR